MKEIQVRPGTLLRWHVLKRILEYEISDYSIVLDIGSYDGFTSHKLTEKYPRLNIILVDMDVSGLQKAIPNGLNGICASALNLPIGDNKVDVVICLDLVEHIFDDNKVIEEISRVLRNNGKVILTTPKENGVNFPLLDRDKTLEINRGWGHVRLGYSKNRIQALLKAHNLSIQKTSGYFNFLTRLSYPYMLSFKISRTRSIIYKTIIRLEPYIKFGTNEHIIIAKKTRGI